MENNLRTQISISQQQAENLAIKTLEQESIMDKVEKEIIQLIQNGVLKIESGNEALFNVLDKYKIEREG